ncbi:MAG: biotin carboxylase N-terminal domain-containing protein, partial [bacterium]
MANRGEIAVRIIRACHQLGMKAVAVYSQADQTAYHIRQADEAYLIGPAPSTESYLVGEKIIEVAIRAGCQAIHPGYGFLAENSQFAQMVEEAGLIFIGPPPEAIALLGDKVASRQLMKRKGIPIIP